MTVQSNLRTAFASSGLETLPISAAGSCFPPTQTPSWYLVERGHLALAALMHEDVGVDRFAAEYASTVGRQTRGEEDKACSLSAVSAFLDGPPERIFALKALARTNGDTD